MQETSSLWLVAAFALGTLCGGGVVALLLRARITAQADLVNTFKALAADTLHQNSAAFLQLAEGRLTQKTQAVDDMVKPVRETLHRMDTQLQALEVKREGAYRELAEMVTASRESQNQLRSETSQLLQALRSPTGRGRWGELQLQRILEMTGMSVHARDFATQVHIAGDDGKLRPDIVVALPGDRCVVIDSKVPLAAYLDAMQSGDEAGRQNALKQHARQVKDHIKQLGAKAYWQQIEGTPEFVVLFLPGEHFLSAALDGDNELMEYSVAQQVVLATPMTLIALLRTVAYGWRQETLQENVRQIADLGRTLHGAVGLFAKQMEQLGARLNSTVETYNKTVNAMERTVLSKAQELVKYGAASSEDAIAVPDHIERRPRAVASAVETEERTEDAA